MYGDIYTRFLFSIYNFLGRRGMFVIGKEGNVCDGKGERELNRTGYIHVFRSFINMRERERRDDKKGTGLKRTGYIHVFPSYRCVMVIENKGEIDEHETSKQKR